MSMAWTLDRQKISSES